VEQFDTINHAVYFPNKCHPEDGSITGRNM